MEATIYGVIAVAAGAAAGWWIGTVLYKRQALAALGDAKSQASHILEQAKIEAENLLKASELDAKQTVMKATEDAERDARRQREEIAKLERRILQREEHLEKRASQLESRDETVKRQERELEKRQAKIAADEALAATQLDAAKRELEQIAGLSQEEAKAKLVETLHADARAEAAKQVKALTDAALAEGEAKAKNIIAAAIQRYAGEYVADRTVTVVNLPSDDMKGRIIGREGRNIRTLESATGIDLVIDDTPEAVILSSFSPARREVAKLTLEKLIQDGRIHPQRIEELVHKAKQEIENNIKREGGQAVFDLDLHNVHPELIKLLGRLKYRFNYGQNQYSHSVETGFLAGMIAGELGANVKEARRAGLLHDIGKAADHELEGAHAIVGAELARRYGEKPRVVHAIRAHHDDEPPLSLLAVIVQAANVLSAMRPGARSESLEGHIKRLEDIEGVAKSFPGVEQAFAIQAGQEIRVVVDNAKVNDAESTLLSRDIARAIERDLTYSGQVRVTVVRETRAIEYAK